MYILIIIESFWPDHTIFVLQNKRNVPNDTSILHLFLTIRFEPSHLLSPLAPLT